MSNRPMTIDQVLEASEQLSAADRLRLISLLSERLRREIAAEGEPIDILSTVGLGAELWHQVDVETYLEQERTSWQR